jgi:hypothetical protein
MTISLRPHWRIEAPAPIKLNPDGTLTFSGPIGPVLLPPSYLEFLQLSDGLLTRGDDSWFISHYEHGPKILQLEYLSTLFSVMNGTWGYQDNVYHDGYTVPKGYAKIGTVEGDGNYTDLQLCVIPGHPDYGKVFTWMQSQDPWMTGENTQGLGYAGTDFVSFMNGLTFKDRL